MKTLLLVVNSTSFYLSHWRGIADFLIQDGWEVHVATADANKVQLAEVEAQGVKYHRISIARGGVKPIAELKTILEIHRLIEQISPSLVHAITIKPVVYTGILCRMAGVPALLAVTGLGYAFLATGFKGVIVRVVAKVMYKLALGGRKSRVVFENSDDINEFVLSRLVSRTAARLVGGAGVDVDRFVVLPEPVTPVVLFAGRLLSDKGVYEFVAAARHIKSHFQNCKFVLAGAIDENNPSAILRHRLNAWIEEGTIEYWGELSAMENVIPKASILVLPSYREGFPRVLQEAAACGRAVVTTDVPGCKDAIENDKTGVLVPPKDSCSLALAIEDLLRNPAKRKSFGQNGRILAEKKFRLQSIVTLYLSIYKELLY